MADSSANKGFSIPSGVKEPKNSSPVEEGQNPQNVVVTHQQQKKEDSEKEYIDKRSVTIALVKTYSLFRQANDKVLPRKVDYIGSSVTSSRTLTSNEDEMRAYMPNIIGISANHDLFISRIKDYFNNFRVKVDELGLTLDTTFRYKHYKDYVAIKSEEDRIEAAYNAVNRNDFAALTKALQQKIYDLNLLESSKWKYGRPTNLEDYLLYRHCLLYNDIAKDTAFINSDKRIRFYFKDNIKEAEKLKKQRQEVNKAKRNYVTCLSDSELFEAIYIQYLVSVGRPVISGLLEDDVEKEIKLDKFSTDEPVKFNRIFINQDNKLIAMIELLIAHGELIRLNHNQNITDTDGNFIGANMNEAVAWFKDPANTSTADALKNRLNAIRNGH